MRLPVATLVCAALLTLFAGQPGAAEDALTNDDIV